MFLVSASINTWTLLCWRKAVCYKRVKFEFIEVQWTTSSTHCSATSSLVSCLLSWANCSWLLALHRIWGFISYQGLFSMSKSGSSLFCTNWGRSKTRGRKMSQVRMQAMECGQRIQWKKWTLCRSWTLHIPKWVHILLDIVSLLSLSWCYKLLSLWSVSRLILKN